MYYLAPSHKSSASADKKTSLEKAPKFPLYLRVVKSLFQNPTEIKKGHDDILEINTIYGKGKC